MKNDRQKLDPEIELALCEQARTHMGVYCQAYVAANGVETKRTEWQDGWNAAVGMFSARRWTVTRWFQNLPETVQAQLGSLLLHHDIELSIDAKDDGNSDGEVKIWVNCNDLFAWACADCEELPSDQLERFSAIVSGNSKIGTDKWCCIQRNMQPQKPIKDRWIEQGLWDIELESLPVNPYDKECQNCEIHNP